MSVALFLALAVAAHKPAAHPVSPAAKRRELAMKAKMETWRGEWRIEPAGVACKTSKTTGDARIDTIGCRAIQVCYAPQVPKIAVIQDGEATDDEKKAQVAVLLNTGKACIARNRALAIEIVAGTRKPPAMVAPAPAVSKDAGR
ncbi:MAG: hypothetical protein H7241_08565 [Novosphingobium sp.]|nr:hypothetical protein [Novosphingobium sp.]